MHLSATRSKNFSWPRKNLPRRRPLRPARKRRSNVSALPFPVLHPTPVTPLVLFIKTPRPSGPGFFDVRFLSCAGAQSWVKDGISRVRPHGHRLRSKTNMAACMPPFSAGTSPRATARNGSFAVRRMTRNRASAGSLHAWRSEVTGPKPAGAHAASNGGSVVHNASKSAAPSLPKRTRSSPAKKRCAPAGSAPLRGTYFTAAHTRCTSSCSDSSCRNSPTSARAASSRSVYCFGR